jgi:hypothetical protein
VPVPDVPVPDVPVPDVPVPDVPVPDVPVDVPVPDVPVPDPDELEDPMTGSKAADAALTLPATSVAVAVRACVPAARAVVVTLHAPLALVVAVPTCVVPSYTLIVLFASALPDATTWWALLTVSLEIVGAAGALVSTVTA